MAANRVLHLGGTLGLVRTLKAMASPVRSYTREEFNALVADAGEPTPDDVSVLVDGRRLDTPDKVRAFYAEMRNAEPDVDSLDL